MTTKHTRGPWLWDSDPIKDDPLNRVRFRVVATGKTVTQCYYSSGDENAEADARLIAAAPELLSALEALMLAAENLDPQSGAPIGYDELLKAIGAADAVRQKARGQA